MNSKRLAEQIRFLVEIDKLKNVYRQSYLTDGKRKENSAEHSWHVSLAAIFLSEMGDKKADIYKTIRMLLVHDIVEIDAGDTYCYDETANEDKEKRETIAAERIFGILPHDQAKEYYALWSEFEEGKTPEAQLAAAADCLMPFLHNYFTQGKSWQEHRISSNQVISRMSKLKTFSTDLWDYFYSMLDKAIKKGYLRS